MIFTYQHNRLYQSSNGTGASPKSKDIGRERNLILREISNEDYFKKFSKRKLRVCSCLYTQYEYKKIVRKKN